METTTDTPELTSYRANCHCGVVSLTVELPSLTDHEVNSCNCSICTHNGYLLVYPNPKNVEFHSGEDHLKSYFFASKVIAHKFCPTCGSSVKAQAGSSKKQYLSINMSIDNYSHALDPHAHGTNQVRMFQEIDVKALKLRYGNWKAEGLQYVAPKSLDTPTLPQVGSELTRYDGNCHCGAVTFTFYIASLAQSEVVECNCSICTRNGYLFVYPERNHVIFHTGYDDLQPYEFGGKVITHKFCPTCGSSILWEGRDRLGINVRMVQDIDLKKLSYIHLDKKSAEPKYMVGK